MKNRKIIKILGVFLILIVSFVTYFLGNDNSTRVKSSTKTTVITDATSGAPRPFVFTNKDQELTGHNIELIEAVFEKLPQYELKIETVAFSSMFNGLKSDRYQMAVNNLAKTEEREQFYLFSNPIFVNSYVAVVSKDSELPDTINDLRELAGLTATGEQGANPTLTLERHNKKYSDKQVKINYTSEDVTSQIAAVESGKFDFILLDKPMFQYFQRELKLEGIKALDLTGEAASTALASPYSYFAFGQNQEKLLEDVNNALEEVIAEGTSKRISENYFGQDYSPKLENED